LIGAELKRLQVMWKCIKCGERIEAEYGFCWSCGAAKTQSKLITSKHDLLLQDFADYTKPRPKAFLLLSIVFEILYWILLPVFVFATLWIWLQAGVFATLFLILLFFPLVELFGRLRKRFRVNSRKALKQSTKAPILYLRSFYYESADKRPRELFETEVSLYERENDDEVLAQALRNVGPLVAVGKSESKIPPLGSIRLYFENEEWQEGVKQLMKICQFAIVQPGHSEGTEWEIQTAKDLLPPEKVIYSFLSWQRLDGESRKREYEVFSMQIQRIYGCELPRAFGAYFLYFKKLQSEGRYEGDEPRSSAGPRWSPQFLYVPSWMLPVFWVSVIPNMIWRFLTKIRAPFPFDGLPRLLRRLPVPRVLRGYSVPSVRETLRPVLKEKGITLLIWRTIVFLVSVIVVISFLVYAQIYFSNPLGNYEVTGYDEAGVILFEGDVHITDSPFKGTADLKLVKLKMKPACFSEAEASSRSVSCQFFGDERESYSDDKYFQVVFTKKTPFSDKTLLFRADFRNGRVLSDGAFKYDECLSSEAALPGRFQMRRKFPWE
jgi:hypothetical protein